MTVIADLPVWAAALTGTLLVLGAGLAFVGSLGLLRLSGFHARMHPPTIGTSFGTVSIAIASMIFFTVVDGRPVVHELLIIGFVTVTTPVSLILLVTASRHRAPPDNGGQNSRNSDDADDLPGGASAQPALKPTTGE